MFPLVGLALMLLERNLLKSFARAIVMGEDLVEGSIMARSKVIPAVEALSFVLIGNIHSSKVAAQ